MPFDKHAETLMKQARIALILKEPFYGSLALRLRMEQDDTLDPPTLAVDGTTMWYHPAWVHANSHEVRKSGVAHEVMHCVYDHMDRRNGREPGRWNAAGDYVINLVLEESKFTVPSTWLIDAKYAGMTTDQVYNLLPAGKSKGSFDLCRDGSKDSKANKMDWEIAVVQAANAAKKAGKLPGAMARFITEMLSGRADWGTLLRRFITETSRDDFSWRHPSRKYAAMGLHMPGLYSERMGTLVVVTDDSGSIGSNVLNAFAGEISLAREAGNPMNTIVLSCDARINHVDTLEPGDEFTLKCHGGGGTDFRPPFEWLEERGIVPAALVYLTDLYGPAPTHAPDYPVMWCCINDAVGPWGETVRIEL